MLTMSFLMLIVAGTVLSKMGFFHMLAGWTLPRGTAKPGVISTQGEISSIPDGEIRFRLNTEIVFDNSYSQGTIMLENPAVSPYDLEFSFYLPGNSETACYISPRLSPGECLVNDKLTQHVSKGYYNCTCIVRAYDENGEYCGSNSAAVSLTINEN